MSRFRRLNGRLGRVNSRQQISGLVSCSAGVQTVEQGGSVGLAASVENPSNGNISVIVEWAFSNGEAITEKSASIPGGQTVEVQASAEYESMITLVPGPGTYDVEARIVGGSSTACGSIQLLERPQVPPGVHISSCSVPSNVPVNGSGQLGAVVENSGDALGDVVVQWVTGDGSIVAQAQVMVTPGESSTVTRSVTSSKWQRLAGVGPVEVSTRLTGRSSMVAESPSERFSVR